MWNGHANVKQVDVFGEVFWKDQYFPEGQYRMVVTGKKLIHVDCGGTWKFTKHYDKDMPDAYTVIWYCDGCGLIQAMEVC